MSQRKNKIAFVFVLVAASIIGTVSLANKLDLPPFAAPNSHASPEMQAAFPDLF